MKRYSLILVLSLVALSCQKKKKKSGAQAPETPQIVDVIPPAGGIEAKGVTSTLNGGVQFVDETGLFSIAITPRTAQVNQAINFTGTCPGSLRWDLGPGLERVETSFSHSFTSVQSYNVRAYCTMNSQNYFRQETISVIEALGSANGRVPNNPNQNGIITPLNPR
jgi:hypothetical protein